MIKEKETILIVDDDSSHRTMLKANLQSAGYAIVEADDGDQVPATLAKKEVDIILLDLKMKRMDGIATLDSLLQAGISTPWWSSLPSLQWKAPWKP